MSDFEMLSIVLMILSIVVTILIAYINQSINIHPPSGWFFIFGHSPNITSHAQVRLLLACQPRAGLLATRKRVSRIE